jgi:hypothetical protein
MHRRQFKPERPTLSFDCFPSSGHPVSVRAKAQNRMLRTVLRHSEKKFGFFLRWSFAISPVFSKSFSDFMAKNDKNGKNRPL